MLSIDPAIPNNPDAITIPLSFVNNPTINNINETITITISPFVNINANFNNFILGILENHLLYTQELQQAYKHCIHLG